MTALEILTDLRQRGARLWTEGDRLRISAPTGVLNPELQSEIARHKSEIMAMLESASRLHHEISPIRPVPRNGSLPVSLSQQRLWFLDRLSPDHSAYTIATWRSFSGAVDIAALEHSLNEIIRRHEILRTTLPDVGGLPIQKIAPPTHFSLPVIDLSSFSEEEKRRESDRIRMEEAKRPFDLQNGPLFRCMLLRLGIEEHIMLFSVHHIICDGWSLGIFAKELGDFYTAFSTGQQPSLPELPIQYGDYAVWQRQRADDAVLTRQLQECVKRLEGIDGFLDLPTDRPRPPVQTHRGSAHTFVIPSALSDHLRTLSRTEDVTLFMTLAGIFTVLLYRYTGHRDILIGCPIAGRDRVELESLIGMFVNTVVLRANVAGDPTFKQLLLQMRETVLEAFSHQDVPFEKLVEGLHVPRSLAYSPVFQVSLALQNTPGNPGFGVSTVSSIFDLTLYLSDHSREIVAMFEYNSDLFDHSTITRMSEHFVVLAEGISQDLHRSIGDLPILPAWEMRQVLLEWNATQTDYPRAKCIHQLFEEMASNTPDSRAVTILSRRGRPGEVQHYCYSEINRRANQLASRLQKLGVGIESRVGLCLERSLEMIVSIVAILKAGGCYVPLDPAYPEERLLYMLDDSEATIVITDTKHLSQLGGCRSKILYLDKMTADLEDEPDSNPQHDVSPDNLAYIIYTSGSTGQPKGVCVTHRNVVRLVKQTNYVNFSSKEVFLLLAPISFDASTFEMWGSLLHGARLVVAPHKQLSLEELRDLIEQNSITTLWLTAGLFHLMVEKHLSCLKGVWQLLTGGDVLSVPHVRRVIEELGENVLINGYGPTENTTFTCCYSMDAHTTIETSVPIGTPISNTRIYILDEHFQPVPIGVAGELFAGGDGVARGYWKRPELTDAVFVPDIFSGIPGSRLYRTGDMVRYRAKGTLEFLGRKDGQVKIRGHRVELGEIETVLAQHPDLSGVTVTVKENHRGEKELVAFVIATSGSTPSASTLRRFLNGKLPAYLIPTHFVETSSFPLSPNGKVDRAALLQWNSVSLSPVEELEKPVNMTEVQMLALWQRVLNNDDIGLRDDFFEVGGHSLLAAELCAEIERVFGQHLSLSTLFTARTPKEIAAVLVQEGWEPQWESLVTIQSGGALPPLFLVPGLGGNVVGFAALARALGPDQPVYGFQSCGFNGKEKPLTRIEDIARRFVNELDKRQTDGPFLLVGVCMGGLVAYEMAQQLLDQGKQVELLILIETWPPSSMRPYGTLAWNVFAKFYFVGQLIVRSWKALRQVKLTKKWDYAWEKLKIKFHAENKVHAALERVAQANGRAAVNYVPKFYSGKTCLILATGRPVTFHKDPRLDWKQLTAPGLDVYLSSGEDSGQMLIHPNAENLGSLLKDLAHKVIHQGTALILFAMTNYWREPWVFFDLC